MLIASADERVPFDLPALAVRACSFRWQHDEIIEGLRCGTSAWREAHGRARSIDVSSGLASSDDITIALPERLAKAVNKRKAEFLAGRLCASLALQQCSGLVHSIPRGADGSPEWPTGYIGSISHADGRAIAIAARTEDYRLLGIDIERLIEASRAEALGATIAGPGEWAQRPATMSRPDFLTVVFSAKEAFYKAISRFIGRIIEFSDVRLEAFGPDWLELELSPDVQAHGLGQSRFHIRYRVTDGHCLTLLAARA